MLHHVLTVISKQVAIRRQASAACTCNVPSTARFYFGYWFSHWRAWYPSGGHFQGVAYQRILTPGRLPDRGFCFL